MTDHRDDYESQLADRLRAAERRVPGGHPPIEMAGTDASRTLRLAVIATMAVAAVGLGAILLLRPNLNVATASPTATASPPPSSTVPVSPSPSASPTSTVMP